MTLPYWFELWSDLLTSHLFSVKNLNLVLLDNVWFTLFLLSLNEFLPREIWWTPVVFIVVNLFSWHLVRLFLTGSIDFGQIWSSLVILGGMRYFWPNLRHSWLCLVIPGRIGSSSSGHSWSFYINLTFSHLWLFLIISLIFVTLGSYCFWPILAYFD